MGGLPKRGKGRGRRRRVPPDTPCPFCAQPALLFHQCRYCDFHMCQQCAMDNDKIFSCNGITWDCPDCGKSNSV
jgi:hypothetical protein